MRSSSPAADTYSMLLRTLAVAISAAVLAAEFSGSSLPARAAAQFCAPDSAHCPPDFDFNEYPSARRWINENVNRIDAALKYHDTIMSRWQTLTANESDMSADLEKLPPTLLAEEGDCNVLDRELRGVTGHFDALPQIAGRECATPMYDTIAKKTLHGAWEYMFHQYCDDPQYSVGACNRRAQESDEYYTADPAAKITPSLRATIRAIAYDFYLSTGKRFYVTSAQRDWFDQANVWTTPEPKGKGWYPLTDAAANDITNVYNKSGHNPWIPIIIAKMRADTAANVPIDKAAVDIADDMLEADLENHPVTKHHSAAAFDVRLMDGYEDDFVEAAHGSHYFVIDDEAGRKNHWHAQIGNINLKVQSRTEYRGGRTY